MFLIIILVIYIFRKITQICASKVNDSLFLALGSLGRAKKAGERGETKASEKNRLSKRGKNNRRKK